MISSFFGIEIARRGLQAQQRALDVTSHNVANANTPGYTRQRANLTTTDPIPASGFDRPFMAGQLGSGVKVDSVTRLRDMYTDIQFRHESMNLGEWSVKENALRQIEAIFDEPFEVGLGALFSEFWNSWHELSKSPESSSVRANVLEIATSLSTSIKRRHEELTELRGTLDYQIGLEVAEVNEIARQLAAMNQEIVRLKAGGDNPNDFLDRRDLLLDELSQLVDMRATEQMDGSVIVYIGGKPLVIGDEHDNISAMREPDLNPYYALEWEDGSAVELHAGSLKGLLDSRDEIVLRYQGQLDALASTFISELNEAHSVGFGLDGSTGLSFFSGSGAADIEVNPELFDLNKIAASASGEPGDGINALAIATLKDGLFMSEGQATFDDFYRGVVGTLGIETREASRMVTNCDTFLDYLTNRRESFSGVSLDEEVVNMVKFQRGYEAASRVISVVDEMLDRLINHTGIVGR